MTTPKELIEKAYNERHPGAEILLVDLARALEALSERLAAAEAVCLSAQAEPLRWNEEYCNSAENSERQECWRDLDALLSAWRQLDSGKEGE